MEEKALTTMNEDVLAKLRENSGEGQAQSFPFIPIFKVNNKKTLEKLPDGREIDALAKPSWIRTDKIGDDYTDTVIEKFGGVILMVKWSVYNRGKYNPSTKSYDDNGFPRYSSRPFSSACFGANASKLLTIKYEDGTIESLSYQDLKTKMGGEPSAINLTATLYVLFNGEVVRVILKGSGRSALFDYMKLFKGNDSMSAHKTAFSAVYESQPQPHNKAVLTIVPNDEEPKYDLDAVLKAQEEVNSFFKADAIAEEFGGHVTNEVEIVEPDDIVAKDLFN